jgi:hypothetical protein
MRTCSGYPVTVPDRLPDPAWSSAARWPRAGYTSGPLFRASINGRGGPLSYDAAHHRWKKFIPGEHEGTLSGST